MLKAAVVTLLVALLPAAASAQAPPARIRGTIEAVDANMLTVKGEDGAESAIKLPASVGLTALRERALSDIKAGDYVGSAAVEGTDGKLHAQEVHIFSEAMRGLGEGRHAMSAPKQSMTNATVMTVMSDPSGRVLKLSYAGGEEDIEVGPEVRIVEIIPADRSLLKIGAAVSVFVGRAPDGALTARAIQVEKDGVKPL